MTQFTNHGGHCCGRYHLYGFDSTPSKVNVDALSRQMSSYARMCGEIVITDEQISDSRRKPTEGAPYKDWNDALIGLGWTKVMRFRNPNSNNMCNVYMYSTAMVKEK